MDSYTALDARFIHETWDYVDKVYICIVGTAHHRQLPITQYLVTWLLGGIYFAVRRIGVGFWMG